MLHRQQSNGHCLITLRIYSCIPLSTHADSYLLVFHQSQGMWYNAMQCVAVCGSLSLSQYFTNCTLHRTAPHKLCVEKLRIHRTLSGFHQLQSGQDPWHEILLQFSSHKSWAYSSTVTVLQCFYKGVYLYGFFWFVFMIMFLECVHIH